MQLEIEKLVFGGMGLARTDQGVIFVEQVLPGEVIEAEIFKKKGGSPVAFPSSIIKKSLWRRIPPCKHYGTCGGCNWQFIEYEKQLQLKKDIFLDCLKRLGKIDPAPEVEIIPSPEWEYRIRAQLKVDSEKSLMGFYEKNTNNVVNINHCPLLDPNINILLKKRDEIMPDFPPGIKEIKIISGNKGVTASSPVILNLTKKETEINVGNFIFTVHGNSFFQGNRFLHEKLGTWPGQHVSGDFFIDMFGGQGFFSIMMGENFSKGLLVESDKAQVKKADSNFLKNNLNHLSAIDTTAEKFFSNMDKSYHDLDCIIVDPPRPGLTRQVRKGIADYRPKTIVYVSCNPSTQARDAGYFVNKLGYKIDRAALFDMFPQTHHMETVLLLRKD